MEDIHGLLPQSQGDVTAITEHLIKIAQGVQQQIEELKQATQQSSTVSADPRDQILLHALQRTQATQTDLYKVYRSLTSLSESLSKSQSSVGNLERERQELTVLFEIAKEINSTLDLEEVLNLVMDKVVSIVQAERGFLMLYDQKQELQFRVARNMDRRTIDAREFQISRTVMERVARENTPVVTTNAQEDERFSGRESIVAYRLLSILCVPLQVKSREGTGMKTIGVIYVDNRIRAGLFGAEHRDLLAAFANQAAIAIQNARLLAEVIDLNAYMENIFRSIASGVITTDIEGIIVRFNRAAEGIFAISSADAVNRPYTAVFEPLQQPRLIEFIEQVRHQNEAIVGQELDCPIPNKRVAALSLNFSRLRNEAQEDLGVAMVIEDLTELKQAEAKAKEIRAIFGQYVHPRVVETLVSNPDALQLGGKEIEVTIIFADIRNFTGLSSRLESRRVVNIVNEYLEILTQAIWEEEGTLTMFIGDALMAFFNAPLPQEDHARRAVRAALGMRDAISKYHRDKGLKESEIIVRYGIGVNTGLALIGNIGAKGKMQNYTAIGSNVNLASRLQSTANDNEIVISQSTYEQVKDYVDTLPPVLRNLKGFDEPQPTYQLIGMKGGLTS